MYAGANTEGYTESVFEDVPIDEWYGGAIAWAVDVGIVDGESEWFQPREHISNEEIAQIMFNYFRWRNGTSRNSTPMIFIINSSASN